MNLFPLNPSPHLLTTCSLEIIGDLLVKSPNLAALLAAQALVLLSLLEAMYFLILTTLNLT